MDRSGGLYMKCRLPGVVEIRWSLANARPDVVLGAVFVVRRTEEILANLTKIEGSVADPESAASVQPAYVDKKTRAIKPELLVLVGLCTHLGCSPSFRPEVAPADLGPDWVGGYFCPCHGSRYDMAGRVYKAQPAPLNLPVPPHSYETDDVIVIGVDQEKA